MLNLMEYGYEKFLIFRPKLQKMFSYYLIVLSLKLAAQETRNP